MMHRHDAARRPALPPCPRRGAPVRADARRAARGAARAVHARGRRRRAARRAAAGSVVVVGGGSMGPEILGSFIEPPAGRTRSSSTCRPPAATHAIPPNWRGTRGLKAAGAQKRRRPAHDRPEARRLRCVRGRSRKRAASGSRVGASGTSSTSTRARRPSGVPRRARARRRRRRLVGRRVDPRRLPAARRARRATTIIMAPGYEEGFGFLRGVAIDQHVVARERLRDLADSLHAAAPGAARHLRGRGHRVGRTRRYGRRSSAATRHSCTAGGRRPIRASHSSRSIRATVRPRRAACDPSRHRRLAGDVRVRRFAVREARSRRGDGARRAGRESAASTSRTEFRRSRVHADDDGARVPVHRARDAPRRAQRTAPHGGAARRRRADDGRRVLRHGRRAGRRDRPADHAARRARQDRLPAARDAADLHAHRRASDGRRQHGRALVQRRRAVSPRARPAERPHVRARHDGRGRAARGLGARRRARLARGHVSRHAAPERVRRAGRAQHAFVRLPERRATIIVLTDRADADARTVADRLTDRLLSRR